MKRYIAIDLLALKENKLSLEEWTLLENIYFMSNNNIGYCFASKETLRDIIQVSNGQIYKIITKLIENGFIVKNKQTGFLKVTQKWIKISSGDTLQKMENMSPKNGKAPLQKMETKKDNIKKENKEDFSSSNQAENNSTEKEILPVDIINFYKKNITDENGKVKEIKSMNALYEHKDFLQEILVGLTNYSKKLPTKKEYTVSLLNFIVDKKYKDYQESKTHSIFGEWTE